MVRSRPQFGRRFTVTVLIVGGFLWNLSGGVASARAAPSAADLNNPITHCLSESDFRTLAVATAPKVNLFREVWAIDPEAEFYGGTSRDYLYWLIGQFKSEIGCAETIARLNTLKAIDVREFLHADSDVDVITSFSLGELRTAGIRPDQYGIRKLDPIPRAVLDPQSEAGKSELTQGHVPVEKIRVGLHEVSTLPGLKQLPDFKDGFSELYSGKLSIHFADPKVFWETLYAQSRENHPILLVLRYIRVLSQDYYQRWGTDYVNPIVLDPAAEKEIEAVVKSVLDGRALRPFFEEWRFRTWFNSSIAKAFRSSANPTATMDLVRRLRIDQLATLYPEIDRLNPYLFFKRRNDAQIRAEFERLRLTPEEVYLPLESVLPSRELFHGTTTEEAFRSILLEGILPSSRGTGGEGVYGVPFNNLDFAADWGNSSDRIVVLDLAPDTKVVDITQGPGRLLWMRYGEEDENEFCERFGIDLLKYPYKSTAFVLKNSGVIKGIRGHTRSVEPLSALLRKVSDLKTVDEFVKLTRQFYQNPHTAFEIEVFRTAIRELTFLPDAVNGLPRDKKIELLLADPFLEETLIPFKSTPKFIAAYVDALLDGFDDGNESEQVYARFTRLIERIREHEAALKFKVKDIPFQMPLEIMTATLDAVLAKPTFQQAASEENLRQAAQALPLQDLYSARTIDQQVFKKYVFLLVRYLAETEQPEASPFDDSGQAQELLKLVLSLDYSDHREKAYRQPEVIRVLKWGSVERLPQALLWALIFNESVMDRDEREILIEKHFTEAALNEHYAAAPKFAPAALFELPLDLIVERIKRKTFVGTVVRERFLKTFRRMLNSYPTLKWPKGLDPSSDDDGEGCSGLLTG